MDKAGQIKRLRQLGEMVDSGALPPEAILLPTRTSFNSDQQGNILADAELLDWIRRLPDFDLIMVLSDIDQSGWDVTLKTIDAMKDCVAAGVLQMKDK